MDPVSIAVSTVTLIQLASKVITLAVEYGKSVSTLPDEVQSLVSEIKLVSQVLTKLHDTLQDAPRNEEQNGLVVSKTDFLKPHMGECQEQLTVLATFLEKGQNRKARMRNFGKRLKWPMQVTETREWIMRMERFKGNCLLVLETEKLIVEKKLCSEMMEMRTAKEIQRIEREREKQSKTTLSGRWLQRSMLICIKFRTVGMPSHGSQCWTRETTMTLHGNSNRAAQGNGLPSPRHSANGSRQKNHSCGSVAVVWCPATSACAWN